MKKIQYLFYGVIGVLVIFSFGVLLFNHHLKTVQYDELNQITIHQIFNRNESKYFVYYYHPSCAICNSIKEDIFQYNDDGIYKLYALDRENDINSSIWDSPENIMGLSNENELRITSTPTLLVIEHHTVVAVYKNKDIVTFLSTQKLAK